MDLPLGVCTPGSRRTPGTSPRTFQQQSAERQQCVGISSSPPPPSPPTFFLAELALALSSSTIKWQREALKKYSLALYFSRGLSIVLAPTCRQQKRKSVIDFHAESLWRRLSSHLLVDLDGLLVLFQLGTVGPDFQQTLVGRTEGMNDEHVPL